MRTPLLSTVVLFCAAAAYGQTPAPAPKPASDTLTLATGETLIGHFVRSTGGNVVFKSDALGELTIAWAKVKELQAGQNYVVLGKGVKLTRRTDLASLPKGAIKEADQVLTVTPAPGAAPQAIPVAEANNVVDEATFQNVLFHEPGFFGAWRGAITGGASLVQATQESRLFTGGIALIRLVPGENWLSPRNRTIVDFTADDGFTVQPNTPKVKTEIYHVDAERDEYFRGQDLYGFAAASFDHNYSQGLSLQSNVGGGLGYTVVKHANTSLDFKGSVDYIRQSFSAAESTHSLMGSNFIETFTHKTGKGIFFQQQITITPTWTVLDDYSALFSGSVTIPVFKRLGFSTGISDAFLNNPPPGFKKNSFQLTTALTYTLK